MKRIKLSHEQEDTVVFLSFILIGFLITPLSENLSETISIWILLIIFLAVYFFLSQKENKTYKEQKQEMINQKIQKRIPLNKNCGEGTLTLSPTYLQVNNMDNNGYPLCPSCGEILGSNRACVNCLRNIKCPLCEGKLDFDIKKNKFYCNTCDIYIPDAELF